MAGENFRGLRSLMDKYLVTFFAEILSRRNCWVYCNILLVVGEEDVILCVGVVIVVFIVDIAVVVDIFAVVAVVKVSVARYVE